MPLPYKIGSNGPEIMEWGEWFVRKYASYAAPADGYYGYAERDAVSELQRRLGLPVTGIFDERTAEASGWTKGKPTKEHRPIWVYSAPGSGADWWIGPPFELGEWVKRDFNLNHQPVGYPKGGYLGLLGGDPGLSYVEVITSLKVELRRLIATCPDLHNPNVEFWFTAYSQSADGMVKAVAELFGDGGEFAHLRSRINGLILFGNPARQKGRTKVGNTPVGWGIARDVIPAWLQDLVWDVSTNNDFYAAVDEGDEIRPAFYDIIIQAETSLPFFVHVLKIAVPIILNYASPALGMFGPVATLMVAGAAGVNNLGPLLGSLMGQAATANEDVDRKLVEILSPTGILKNIPGLLKLIGALPGLQSHGEYHLPKPEFNGRTGIQVGYEIVRDFRR